MLRVATVDLPESVTRRLAERAAFSESWGEFLKEHLAGFRQPVAAAAALIGPILVAFVYAVSDFTTMVEVAGTFGLTAIAFLLGAWYVNRHDIREAYARHMTAQRQAKADLKAGRGVAADLLLKTRPSFYEHEHGVIVLADSGDGRTLYFDVDGTGDDPRWFLYVNGDMHRGNWRWLKLLGSGNVTEFEAKGQRLAGIGDTPYVDAPDAWEAISLALGEPQDGDVVDMPFEEVKQTVSRLL
ncbi:hypothetical protein [Parvularcula dongshanensis]|uniref:Uncharacterized protein n=1 Tax=Parvularcula dongshanensis TaxID=1173995 RepID=A0A840I208_9PROT|nr:hypothetical protein [Parvularcula dongshanensis]MBB4658787.1 hypothetical protein [Parvularcula dongshanensis]